jgi:L-lysine 2,3-aminomutase
MHRSIDNVDPTVRRPMDATHNGLERFHAVTRANVAKTPEWSRLDPELRRDVMVVSTVLPFRTNAYVMRELIDWSRVPDDAMYQLTFPQKGMLSRREYATMARLVDGDAPRTALDETANRIRLQLNPHPAGQMTHNVPVWQGAPLEGVQHKYAETVLFFPSKGQTCHSYCTFCFRWAQFVGMDELKFAADEVGRLVGYLKEHKEVRNVLFTGGDPMIMTTAVLARYLEPLLTPELEHIHTIRIGTKAVAYWPHRFVTDGDADDLLRLFEKVGQSGRQLAIMGHYSHPVELSTPISQEAVRRIRSTGANIRMQSPVVKHVNDDPMTWVELWKRGSGLGCIPYYMFVERDTGARRYFEIPLVRCWKIYREAYSRVSGLARTVRGPSMSAFPGKVHLLGVADFKGQKLFVLQFLQARDPQRVRRPFFAKFDPKATWFDQLKPATSADKPFFARATPADGSGKLVNLGLPLAASDV